MTTFLRSLAIPALISTCTILASCGGGSDSDSASSSKSSTSTPTINPAALKGATVFKKTCATCHGLDAKGMPDNGPDMHNNEFIRTNSDEQLLEYVITGRVVEDGADMPPRGGFTKDILPDEDIKAVLTYIRNFDGNAYTGP